MSFKDEPAEQVKQTEDEFYESKEKFKKRSDTVKLGFIKSEIPDDALEMEPECDLSFTSEKSNFELIIYFQNQSSFQHCFAFQINVDY